MSTNKLIENFMPVKNRRARLIVATADLSAKRNHTTNARSKKLIGIIARLIIDLNMSDSIIVVLNHNTGEFVTCFIFIPFSS
jgi:hypothetical protein